jgi:hypothetical protein
LGERAVSRRTGNERFASGAVVRASMALTPTLDDEQTLALYGSWLSTYVLSVRLNSRQWLGQEAR